MSTQAEPGRVLVVGTESGWREYTGTPPGYAGELVLPNGPLTPYDPQDRGIIAGVQVWSIRDPYTPLPLPQKEETP